MRYYYDMQVIGVKITAGFETLPLEVERLNISAALIIYSPFHLASKKISIPSIGISHGVYWDNRSFQNFPTNLNKTIDDIISKLEIVSSIVSVDTNTINWLRATRSDLSSNAAYVPNFVDLNQFTPVDKPNGRLVVLYPRRLYEPLWFLACGSNIATDSRRI